MATRGKIYDPESGAIFSEGEGTFVKQPIESFGRLIEATQEKRRIDRERAEQI